MTVRLMLRPSFAQWSRLVDTPGGIEAARKWVAMAERQINDPALPHLASLAVAADRVVVGSLVARAAVDGSGALSAEAQPSDGYQDAR